MLRRPAATQRAATRRTSKGRTPPKPQPPTTLVVVPPQGMRALRAPERPLGLLLADPQVLAALTRIAEEPCALDEYAADAVVMGVLHSVCATHSIAPQLMPQLPLQNDVPSAAPPHFEARNRTNV
jgi:hypothetical protein